MTIPVRLGLVDADNGDLPLVCDDASPQELEACVFALEAPSRTLTFRNVPRRPALVGAARLLGAGQRRGRSDRGRPSDAAAARQRPLQPLAGVADAGRRSVEARRAGDPRGRGAAASIPPSSTAYGAVVDDALAGRIDPAFAALALHLPSEADIAREIGRDVDPDAIRAAREALRGRLGRAHSAGAEGAARRHGQRRPVQPRRRQRRPPRVAQRRARR